MSKSRAELRRLVVARARGCYEYCLSQARYSTHSFAIEHIIPKHRGGKTEPNNLALSCQGCNNHKHTKVKARDPLTRKLAPLFNPRRHKWTEHFTWRADYLEIIGLTPTGRATISTLHLNRAEVINLRRVLSACGEHPPLTDEISTR
ncbi:MAG: HNH endonuclease signature motif containing protein [Acidobacteriota bacterium]